jgi:hypothetical protein
MHRAPDADGTALGLPLLLWLLPWAPCRGDCPHARGATDAPGENDGLARPTADRQARQAAADAGGDPPGTGTA